MNFFAAASLSGPGRDFISLRVLPSRVAPPLFRGVSARLPTSSRNRPSTFDGSINIFLLLLLVGLLLPRRFHSPLVLPPGTGNPIPSSFLSSPPCPCCIFEHPQIVTDFDERRGEKSSGPTMAIVLKATDHRCPPIPAYASWSTVRLSRASRVVRTVVPSCIPFFRKCSWNTRGWRSSMQRD